MEAEANARLPGQAFAPSVIADGRSGQRAKAVEPDQDEGDVWLQMLDDRNLTSHAYDETLAVRIYTRIVHDYAPRLAQMAEKIQTLRWD